MGIKKEVKEEITRILEENFNFILNTQDSILNLEKTLSTENLKISMYHIKTFMKNNGYTHNKTTNEWDYVNNTEHTPSNNKYIKSKESNLKNIEPETITDDLKEFLKENSNKKEDIISDKNTPNSDEKNQEINVKSPLENIRESSLIPEENIIKEIWKITDNTSSNCEAILRHLLSLSKQLSETILLSSNIQNETPSKNNDYIKISREQLTSINYSESKRYELSLTIGLVNAIKEKFFLSHPEITSIEKLKDSKILPMILFDYLISK